MSFTQGTSAILSGTHVSPIQPLQGNMYDNMDSEDSATRRPSETAGMNKRPRNKRLFWVVRTVAAAVATLGALNKQCLRD
jgi:hypothetical protein